MATSSFGKKFVLTTKKEVERFNDTFKPNKVLKPIKIISMSIESERQAERKLKQLLFL